MRMGMISKRLLSMLLVFAMLAGMLPAAAFAAEDPAQTVEPTAAEDPAQTVEPTAANEPAQAAEPALAEPAAEGDAVASLTTAEGATTNYNTLDEAIAAAQSSSAAPSSCCKAWTMAPGNCISLAAPSPWI